MTTPIEEPESDLPLVKLGEVLGFTMAEEPDDDELIVYQFPFREMSFEIDMQIDHQSWPFVWALLTCQLEHRHNGIWCIPMNIDLGYN